MRARIVGAGAVVAALIVPLATVARAEPAPSGYAEVFGQYGWEAPKKYYRPLEGGGIAARGTLWLAPSVSLQGDLSADYLEAWQSGGFAHQVFPQAIAALHLNWRDPSHGLIGGFGGVASLGFPRYEPDLRRNAGRRGSAAVSRPVHALRPGWRGAPDRRP